ncbi:fatty acid metabolism transcriptional regulator FadR [Bacillaceae bacterium]
MTRTKNREKYHLILNAAQKVIAQNGFHRSQISKIAREAGVADGTIYLYFKNKEEILISLFRERLGEQIKACQEAVKKADNAIEALKKICQIHYDRMENNIDFAYVTQIELRQPTLELRKAIGQMMKPYYELIEKILRQGIEEGIFRPDLNVKLARFLLFGAIDEVVTSWLLGGQKFKLSEQVEDTIDFFLHGIGSQRHT